MKVSQRRAEGKEFQVNVKLGSLRKYAMLEEVREIQQSMTEVWNTNDSGGDLGIEGVWFDGNGVVRGDGIHVSRDQVAMT